MKPLIALFALSLLSGCATISRPEPPLQIQTVQVPGESKPTTISGRMQNVRGFASVTHPHAVIINGETVAEGVLPAGFTGEIYGKWNGKRVVSACRVQGMRPGWTDVRCQVFIDGQPVTELMF